MDELNYEELMYIYGQAKKYKLDGEFIALIEKKLQDKKKSLVATVTS